MRALLAVLGEEANRKSSLLYHLLARERDYWTKRMKALGLSTSLLPALEAAMFKLCEGNKNLDRDAALKLLGKTPCCRDLPEAVRVQLYRLLRECYPHGADGIGPLQPDELRIYAVSHFAGR
jgi:hypothetical protein